MLQASFDHAKEDIQVRQLREQQVVAEHLLVVVKKALQEDADKYLSQAEKNKIIASLQHLETIGTTQDSLKLKQAVTELEQATQIFAERRMDGNLREALQGVSIEELPHAKD